MSAASSPSTARAGSFARLMAVCISARLLIDIGMQMFHPFLPVIAAGLGTNVVVMGRLLSVRSAMGLLAPYFGSLADRRGYRVVLRGALFTSAAGMAIIGASRGIPLALCGMALSGLGMAAFVPTLQAYLSARLPYARRARGMGILEYSWAITGIVGLSLMGWLIAASNWRMPFFVLSAGLVVMAVVFGSLPPASEGRSSVVSGTKQPARGLVGVLDVGENRISTYATIGASAGNYFAAMILMIIYGAWYTDAFHLDARALGIVALLFGCFDLTASVSVSLFTDRIGKRRSVLMGTAGALVGYLCLPWLNVGIVPAVLGLGLARCAFEFAIVSSFPLLSEQVPARRAKVMSLSAAVSLGTVTIASVLAPIIYTRLGIPGAAALSAGSASIALALLLVSVRENSDPPVEPDSAVP